MFIFSSDDSDPMLLDSLSGMNLLHKKLESFLQSTQQYIEIAADTTNCSHLYDRQLLGFRVIKSEGGISLRIDHQNWLVLSGDPENLRIYISHFEFESDEEGAHHHPEYEHKNNYLSADTLCLIIEVDSDTVKEL